MNTIKTGMLAALVFISTSATPLFAFDWFGGRLSIGGGYGYSKPKLPYAFQNSHEHGRMWTVHMKYFLTDDFSIVASYADMFAEERAAERRIQFRPIIGSLRYHLFKGLPFTPYITAGAGVSRNRREVATGPNIEWTKLALQGGMGLEFFVNQNTSLGAEALYHHITPDAGQRIYRPISAVGTVNLYFGEGPQTAKARQDAEEARRQADASAAQAAAAQAQALAAQQAQQASASDAEAARLAAQNAQSARSDADRQAQELQSKMQTAQSEIDRIKEMVARKELKPINFKTGSAELLPESNEALNKVAETTKKYSELKLRVEGHTDSVGDDGFNQRLSQQRADSVRDYLTSQGVPSYQMEAFGLGESKPVASNDSASGRAQNRRVEFHYALK
jgi:outer membrane protein OmpA-like peptidoglycan-associated protein